MKIRQVIEKLSKFDPEADATIYDESKDRCVAIEDIAEATGDDVVGTAVFYMG